MEVVLRVKRKASEEPIDYITLNKRPKNFESYFSNLSLSPKLVLKRAVHEDPQKFTLPPPKPPQSNPYRDEQRQKIMNHFRNSLISQESLIYYNGKPLKTEANPKSSDTIIEEYVFCDDTDQDPDANSHNILVDFSDTSDEDFDSQDSNCEEHPWNDYPDEESSESGSDKSVEYEEYEVDDYN